ncbi:MAG: endonuclease/exonuclease/phosphatase family protein [Bacteroidetes bacterium]|nr:endonuclease/exonuclease/phosphatase family protein [Bacteroidota bacterium]
MTAKKKGKGHPFLRRVMLVLNILAAIALLLAYAASYISPARYWIFSFFGLAYPFLLALNLFFVLLWLLFWKRFIWISIIVISLGINHILSIVQYRKPSTQAIASGGIKIISYNVHSLYEIHQPHEKGKARGRMLSKVTDFLVQQNPDILCIQEFFLRSEDSLKVLQKFTGGLHTNYSFIKNYVEIKDKRKIFAIATFSRFPIVAVGHLRISKRNIFAVYTDLAIGKDTVRVFNIHLESIRFGKNDYSFYAQLTDQAKEPDDNFDLGEGSFIIFSKLRKAFEIRAKQVDILKENIKNSHFPVIICGDFNDTPASYTYQQMTSGFHDSFCNAGTGFLGSTYAGSFPSFRIDYILYDDAFSAYNYSRNSVNLSDHYPIQVFLKKR